MNKRKVKGILTILTAVIFAGGRHGWRCNNALAGVFAKQKLLHKILAGMLIFCVFAACGDKSKSGPKAGDRITSRNGIVLAWIPPVKNWPVVGNDGITVGGTVTLTKGFYMGIYEVTQKQWEDVMGDNPSYFHGGTGREQAAGETQNKRPVEMVSWYDAIVFCNKLSIAEGLTPVYTIYGSTEPALWGSVPTNNDTTWNAVTADWNANGYRLPTEAQWQYAAQAGLSTEYTAAESIAWYAPHADSKTREVGKKAPNRWGLYDMLGNVWEWCWDRYAESPYPSSDTDPEGASSGNIRVLRGGNCIAPADNARSAYRGQNFPYYSTSGLGLRVVRPAQ